MKRATRTVAPTGFSLVELLVALGLGTLVLAIAFALLLGHARLFFRLQGEAYALAGLHWAMQQIAADLYVTGLDPQGVPLSRTLVILDKGFSRLADLDGNGVIDSRSSESVTVSYSSRGDLRRTVGRQPMALLAGLRPGGFTVRFIGASEAVPAGLEMAATEGRERAQVQFAIGTTEGGFLSSRIAMRWIPGNSRTEYSP